MKLIAHEKNVTERDIQIAYNKKKRKMRNGKKLKNKEYIQVGLQNVRKNK